MLGLFVAESTWEEVKETLEAGAVGILPVGAACKEHGLHLPMNTDLVQADWLCRSLAEQRHVVVWPAVAYGHYPAFTDYPGSCSLSTDCFAEMITEILNDILKVTQRNVFVLNTGISTIPSLQKAIERTSESNRVQLMNVYEGPRVKSVIKRIEEQANGSHADEIETSIMLAIAPDLVDMKKATVCTRELVKGPLNRTDAAHPNYSPSGVYGDARLASKPKGHRLVTAILEDILENI